MRKTCQMVTLLSRGREIEYTILPYDLDTPIEDELKNSPSELVLGYVKEDTGGRRWFWSVDPPIYNLGLHFSISVLKKFPYCDQSGPWIVYKGTPSDASSAFREIGGKYAKSLHIYGYDTWHVEVDTVVAVITDSEIY